MNMGSVADFVKRIPVAILIVYALLSAASFWTAHERELINILDDDAYYYFTIARNVAEKGQLTFDGTTISNGYHPLWLIILVPFFRIWDDPMLALRVIGTFSVMLAGLTGTISLRYLSRHSLLSYSLAATLVLTCIISFGSTGMETTVLLPLLVVALLLLEHIQPWRADSRNIKSMLVLGAVLALAQLARLDAVLLNGMVFLFVAAAYRRSGGYGRLAALGAAPFITGVGYLVFNYSVFGHLVPTSGMAKSLGSDSQFINTRFVEQLITGQSSDGTLWQVFLGMVVLAAGYLAILLLAGLKNRRLRLADEQRTPAIAAAFILVFATYQLFGTSWVLWRWYAYPILPMSLFVVPRVVEQMEQRLMQRESLRASLRALSAVVVALTLIRIATVGIRCGYWREPLGVSFQYANYQTAQLLNERLPRPATVAMGDRAGSFAYFFDGNILQLEGLTGDYQILEAIKSNTLMDYMSAFGVDYVVSHAGPPVVYSQWTLLNPLPKLSTGPYAEIRLCAETEYLRFEAESSTIYVWGWPSCAASNRLTRAPPAV